MKLDDFPTKPALPEVGDFVITPHNSLVCVCAFTTGNEGLAPKGWIIDGLGMPRNPKFLVHYTGPENVVPEEVLAHRDALKLVL